MEVIILASGSKGNLVLLIFGEIKILVDMGLTYKKTKEKLNSINLEISDINYIIITHEHSDHAKGIQVLCKNLDNLNILMTKGTYKGLNNKSFINDIYVIKPHIKYITPYETFNIENIKVTPILNSHDVLEPIGVIFEYNNKKIVQITDTGYISDKNIELIKNSDCYILESNHDLGLLQMDLRRDLNTKIRIKSDKGHLSNIQACDVINKVINKNKKTIWIIAHISEDCNTKDHIEREIINSISNIENLDIYYTSQDMLEKIIV